MHLSERATESEIKSAAAWATVKTRGILGAVGSYLPESNYYLAERLDRLALETFSTTPAPKNTTLAGRIARMCDPSWWTRNLRRSTLRRNEAIEQSQGAIWQRGQCYVSDHASQIKRARDQANRATLAGLEVVSDAGEVVNLLEAADASVSNPKHRRGELMTRARGFEEMAELMGHGAVFLTLTCPSRFHRKSKWGQDYGRWDGSTAKDAQAYLCKVWTKIRAAWNKAGFSPYGFRVAEPHHDGCPHWHILLFAPVADLGWFKAQAMLAGHRSGAGILGIAGRFALRDNMAERGAYKRRFLVKHIDAKEGSATGYIAKYICKNIDGTYEDGTPMGDDYDSKTPAQEAARRVRDWASTWGIRQFQQIGGPSVTVYRELRRLGEGATCQQDLFEGARKAADEASWMIFWLVQGGPDVKRAELAIRPLYVADSLGKYGDEVKRIKGVSDRSATVQEITRTKEWTVQRAGKAATWAAQAEFDAALAWGQKNAAFLQAYEDSEFKRTGAARRTWTGVNNCNPDPYAPFDFSVFPEPDAQEFAPDHPQALKNDVLHPITGLELWTERLIATEKDTREAIEQATAEENRQARAWGRPTMDKATARRALRAHWEKKWNTQLLNPSK